jgi:molybdate transport system substrate-binding protein
LLLTTSPLIWAESVIVLSASAVKAPLNAAQDISLAATGYRLQSTFGTSGAVIKRVEAGEQVDIVVLPTALLDELVHQGFIAAEGRISLGTVLLGIAVRSGTAYPLIATTADVRKTLLECRSIGLADPASGATTGVYFAKLFKEMRLEDEGVGARLPGRDPESPDSKGPTALAPIRAMMSRHSPASRANAPAPHTMMSSN